MDSNHRIIEQIEQEVLYTKIMNPKSLIYKRGNWDPGRWWGNAGGGVGIVQILAQFFFSTRSCKTINKEASVRTGTGVSYRSDKWQKGEFMWDERVGGGSPGGGRSVNKVSEVRMRTCVFSWPGESGVWISWDGNWHGNKGRTEFKAATVLVRGISAFLFRGF